MKLVNVYIPENDIEVLDKLIEAKRFPNRNEAIRFAIHDMTRNKDTFEGDPRIENLTEICVSWNERKVESKEAMWRVWKLFEKDNLKRWNKREGGR